ncbi:hypothetical protein FRACA_2800003 [Frankia canadensis]|uniref:Uncharacterized protein n=1 Tax=Frankia canadensis TaxID=1836972 RepID=A0A2I2KT38_9ACTN|nr:hypothetical protein FRACA_2800003 [Frankia canadensis]SOU56112.1 hypothetical protein FRACA_2800003 [Frankia canadensis]
MKSRRSQKVEDGADFPWMGIGCGGRQLRVANSAFPVRFVMLFATRTAVTLSERCHESPWAQRR